MLKSLILLTALLLPVASFADWKHIQLVTAEGVTVQLDYETKKSEFNGCYKCNLFDYAEPLWIHVKHPALKTGDKIRVVFINYERPPYINFERTDIKEFDLVASENGTFSIEAGRLPIRQSGYGGTHYYRQEVAVVINGQWLKNAENPHSSNIGFKLFY